MSTHANGKSAAQPAKPAPSHIEIRVKRRDGAGGPERWESFKLPYKPNLNVISCLQEIQRNPVTADGSKTTPVVWDCSCLEEVCGACSMIVNGKVRQACTALIDQLEQPVTLEPMTKFPLVRDLMVDRQRIIGRSGGELHMGGEGGAQLLVYVQAHAVALTHILL